MSGSKSYIYCLLRLIAFSFFFQGSVFSQTDSLRIDSLSQDSLVQIAVEEVVVRGRSENKISGLSVGKVVLTPDAVSKLPSFFGGTDLLKLLELTPSASTSGDANTNMYVRGGDAGQNLLLYDDVPLYTPGHLLGFFPLFNSDHISSLELQKSGINATYGGRLSSVIAVGVNKRMPPELAVKGSVGLLSSQLNLQLPIGNKWGLYVSGRKTYIDLVMNPILDLTVNHNANNEVEGLNYDFYDVNASLIGHLSDRDKVTFDFFRGKDKLNMQDEDFMLKGDLGWSTILFSSKWEHWMDDNMLSQQLYFSSYDNNLLTSQGEMGIKAQSNIKDIGYKGRYVFSIDKLRFESGLQYAYHIIDPQVFRIASVSIPSDATKLVPLLKMHEATAYLSSRINITEKLHLDCGLRYNLFYNEKMFHSIDPRVALYYRMNNDIVFRGAYSRQNQYLNRVTVGSVGLPIDSWVTSSEETPQQIGNEFSLGYFQMFKNQAFEVSAELYYRTMNNLNEYSLMMTDWQNDLYKNTVYIGKGHAYGLELLLKKNHGKFTGWLSYALGKSAREFPLLNNGNSFPARYDRRHDLSLAGTYSFNEHWDMSLVYTYATGNAYTLPSSWYFINNTPVKEYGDYNGARMPNYNRTDFSVNYWYKKNNGIVLSVYNLFMVNNPIYIFMNVVQDEETGSLKIKVKQKKLYTIMPSISWRFNF